MAICTTQRIKKFKLCTSDLRHRVQVQERVLTGNQPNQFSPEIQFTTIASPWSAVETTRGTSKFSGVNITDDISHIFSMRYNVTLNQVEAGNHFIVFKERRFRIVNVTNVNEDDTILSFECTERGDEIKEATEA